MSIADASTFSSLKTMISNKKSKITDTNDTNNTKEIVSQLLDEIIKQVEKDSGNTMEEWETVWYTPESDVTSNSSDIEELEVLELDLEGWIKTAIIDECCQQAMEMSRFKSCVDRFTKTEYLKFRVRHWRNGWAKFLTYLESPGFEHKLRIHLLKRQFTTNFINNVLAEYRQDFFETVRGEEANLSQLADTKEQSDEVESTNIQ